MSAHLPNCCKQFREREDGDSATEYAVMIGTPIVGVIIALIYPSIGWNKPSLQSENPLQSENAMTAMDARQALIALVHAHPASFDTSEDQVRSASVVRKAGYVEIALFRCNLQARTFEYASSASGAARSQSEISGAFYQNANRQWVGTITRNSRD